MAADGNAAAGGGALRGGGGVPSALCSRQRRAAVAAVGMGGYELVRSDDAAGAAPGPDLESGAGAGAATSKAAPPSPAARQPRLVSLDVFRGITVLLMIIVDDAGGFIPALNHSPWDGVTIADFVMPFFLFIVGVSLTLAYKRVPDKLEATKKAVLRALKLFCLGLVLQGGFFHGVHSLTFGVDLTKIRLMGILQRIAIAYLLAAICEIWLKRDDDVDSGLDLLSRYRYQLFVVLVLSFTYTVLLYGIYVPDWEYQISGPGSREKSFSVKCGVRGDTGPACNAVGMVDRTILGIDHLYGRPVYARTKECSINYPENGPLPPDAPSWCQAPFDPEGLLSSVMAFVTCLIGLQFGHIIIHFEKHRGRITNWLIPSFSMLAVAFLMGFVGMRMNKPLNTISYTLATAGAAGLLFAGIYTLVDVYGFRRPTITMEWMGKHALMIYVLVACNILPMFIRGFYWRDPNNSLLKFIGVGA
ncbi:heparan-alpha-glucosaminide N-acetyltransferase-like isoform X1 [Panicum virgatum]|nr:heparan-alpha-glucosaminide N-acetyltransferase-like isoform X1 [Panicum virgatum]